MVLLLLCDDIANLNLVADHNTTETPTAAPTASTPPTSAPSLSTEELAARYWPWYGYGDLLPCVPCLEVAMRNSTMWEQRIGRRVQFDGEETTRYTPCLPAPEPNCGQDCLPCRVEGKFCSQVCPAVARGLREVLWQYFVVELPKATPYERRTMLDQGPPVGLLKEKIYELICRHRWFWPPHNTA